MLYTGPSKNLSETLKRNYKLHINGRIFIYSLHQNTHQIITSVVASKKFPFCTPTLHGRLFII